MPLVSPVAMMQQTTEKSGKLTSVSLPGGQGKTVAPSATTAAAPSFPAQRPVRIDAAHLALRSFGLGLPPSAPLFIGLRWPA